MSKIRVLLVDDNPAILEALAGMLRPNFAVVGLILEEQKSLTRQRH